MPTNAEIMQQISALERRMDGYEQRMKSYEEQASENTKLLKDVKATTDFIKNTFKALRFASIAICSAALWQVGSLVFHVLTGH